MHARAEQARRRPKLVDDTCPVLATADVGDQDGDGIGNQCDRWMSQQAPRPLLTQAIALATNAGVPLPGCVSRAMADAAWVTDFHLTDREGTIAFRCAKRIYRAIATAADGGNQLAAQARMLAGEAIASLGEEAVAALLALGASPADPVMAAAIANADAGVSALAANDPQGAKDLFRGRKQTEIADKDGMNVLAGDQMKGRDRLTMDGWKIDRADAFNSPCATG